LKGLIEYGTCCRTAAGFLLKTVLVNEKEIIKQQL